VRVATELEFLDGALFTASHTSRLLVIPPLRSVCR
jgi:hypothetical protein